MEKREIILQMDSRKYDALRRALLAHDTDPRAEMQKRLDACYQELVPAQERNRIADAMHKAGALDADGHQDIAAFRVVENGGCRCFLLEDSSVDALEIADRLRRYLIEGRKDGFAGLFERQTPIPEQEYIDHIMDALCNCEETANIFHVNLDCGAFSVLDPKDGWWSYPLLDAANSARLIPKGMDTGREQRDAYFRQMLDGKRIVTDDRCLLIRGDHPLKASDFGIRAYDTTMNGFTTFELNLYADMETVFGLRIADNGTFSPLVLASYSISKETVYGYLEISLLRDDEPAYFLYQMDAELADAVIQKMDNYCMKEFDMNLASWAAKEQKKQDSHSQSWECLT